MPQNRRSSNAVAADTNGGAKPHSDSEIVSATHQTHVWLNDSDIEFLDSWAFRLRRSGWNRATRSACVRAMINVLRDTKIELVQVSNEQELAQAIELAITKRQS